MKIPVILTLVAIMLSGCSEQIGGISPSYPVRDYDPKLTEIAQTLVPVIRAIEEMKKKEGDFPQSTDAFSGLIKNPENLYYLPEKESFRLGIKLGWDPSLWFDSDKQAWEFDPGDGSPSKVIKIKVEPAGIANDELAPHRD